MWIIEEEASHYRRKQPEGDESQMMNKTYLPMSEEKLEVWAINQRLPPHKKGSNLLIKRALWKSLLSLVACRVFILSIIYINMYKLSKKRFYLYPIRDIRCCQASLNTWWSCNHVSTPITPEWSLGRRIPTEIQSRTAGVLQTQGLGLHFQFYSYTFYWGKF